MKNFSIIFTAMLFVAFGFSSCTDDTEDLKSQIAQLEQKMNALNNASAPDAKDWQAEIDALREQLKGKYSKAEIDELLQKTLAFGVSGVENGRFYVDLGLPSGNLWATCNIGATFPEEIGDYFAWGETKPKETYTRENYFRTEYWWEAGKKYDESDSYGGQHPYKTLKERDDAAVQNWGGKWRMPSIKEFQELFSNVNTSYYYDEQRNGIVLKSKKNDNSIFLPRNGYRYEDKLGNEEDCGYYWTQDNTTDGIEACYWGFQDNDGFDDSILEYEGLCIRPIVPGK